jgi:Pectate lyase superfamily protein/Right handed beta helix region
MLNNVEDFGAVGDGVVDDRLAIQAAIDDAVVNNKGGILFPSGTYRVSRTTVAQGRWSLDLNGVQDFMVAGQGPRSIVKLADTTAATGEWHVFILREGSRCVTFTDLVVDGNHTGLTEPDEQSHGIEVESGTEDLVIDRCILRECFDDGVRLRGAPGANVRRVRIHNTLFQRNRRSGLGVQNALEQIIAEGCIFHDTISDQSIDFEPSGADGPTDFLIHGCVVVHTNPTAAITLSGIGGPDPSVRVKLADCVVVGGEVLCTDVAQLTIQGNTIVVPETAAARLPVYIRRGGDAVLITGNLLISESPQTQAVITISEANQRQVTRARIEGNLCFAGGGAGIECVSSDDVTIAGNLVIATGTCTQAILVRSQRSPMDGIAVRDNDITVTGAGAWDSGIHFAARATQPVGGFLITGNAIRGASNGVRFAGDGFRVTPVCALNRIDAAVAAPLVGLETLPEHALTVSGAASRGSVAAGSGAGRILIGRGDPNGRITGDVGDLFQRLDGGAGSTLYVKESGAATAGGWSAK